MHFASFPKVVKYWPATSHLQQTWGGVRHYFIHQHLQRFRSLTATFLTWHATCPSYSHGSKNDHHLSYHKSFQIQEFWCTKNHPISPLQQRHPLSGGQGATIVIDIQVAFVDQQGAVTSSSQQATQMMNQVLGLVRLQVERILGWRKPQGKSNHPRGWSNLLKVSVDLKFHWYILTHLYKPLIVLTTF